MAFTVEFGADLTGFWASAEIHTESGRHCAGARTASGVWDAIGAALELLVAFLELDE